MPLNNSQYNEIIRSYDARQLANQRLLEERTRLAYEQLPELKEIDDGIASCSVAQARRLLDGDGQAISSLRRQLAGYREKKAALLREHGFPADYFEPIYTCADCKDTGFIGMKRCHCFEQAAIDLVYTQSNLKDVLSRENFGTFSFRYGHQSRHRNVLAGHGAGRRGQMPRFYRTL